MAASVATRSLQRCAAVDAQLSTRYLGTFASETSLSFSNYLTRPDLIDSPGNLDTSAYIAPRCYWVVGWEVRSHRSDDSGRSCADTYQASLNLRPGSASFTQGSQSAFILLVGVVRGGTTQAGQSHQQPTQWTEASE
jgi:hypothetical protein